MRNNNSVNKGTQKMACEHCTDEDGEPYFPSYGLAPHISFNERGEVVASDMLPDSEEATDFTPDPDAPGMGTYHCPKCGHGKPGGKPHQEGPRRQFFWNDLNAGESWHLGSEDDLDAASRSVMHSIRAELDEILIAGDHDRMYSIEVKTMTQAEVDALPDM